MRAVTQPVVLTGGGVASACGRKTLPDRYITQEGYGTPQPEVGYAIDIGVATALNQDYRRVLKTTAGMQVIAQSLLPGVTMTDLRTNTDTFLCIRDGSGIIEIGNSAFAAKPGASIVVPTNVRTRITNCASSPLKFFVVYSTPQYPAGYAQRTACAEPALEEDKYQVPVPAKTDPHRVFSL